MNNEVDQFLATSPNPVLRVDKNGIILYSNEAGEPLLNVWGTGVGKKLPSNIRNLVQRVILRNSPEKMEIKVGERLCSIVFHPLYEEKCVCISGFDISDQNELKEKKQESEAQEKVGVGLADGLRLLRHPIRPGVSGQKREDIPVEPRKEALDGLGRGVVRPGMDDRPRTRFSEEL